MVDDLLRSFGQFKSNMEYRNVDFNADKTKQHEAVRKATAKKYCSIDVSWFRPEATTLIPDDIEESQKEELNKQEKSEKVMIKKGYSRVMEKIKEWSQRFSNAITRGSRSGSGKLVMEFYDTMVQIWWGSPSMEPLPFGIQSSKENNTHPDEENAIGTTSGTSNQPDQSSEDGSSSSDQSASWKRPLTSSPVVHLVNNKRKHTEQQLSSAKGDQILINEAREDNNSRKELADSLLQSNQVFAESIQAVSSSMMSIAQSTSRSFELLTHALMVPQQGMTQ